MPDTQEESLLKAVITGDGDTPGPMITSLHAQYLKKKKPCQVCDIYLIPVPQKQRQVDVCVSVDSPVDLKSFRTAKTSY